MFNNKVLMITGGTGSFGSTVLKKFLDSDLKEIRIFSRDDQLSNIHIQGYLLEVDEIFKQAWGYLSFAQRTSVRLWSFFKL